MLVNPFPVGNAGAYDSRSLAVSSNIPSIVSTVITNGYYNGGDKGGGTYKRVGAQPSHSGWFCSNDGAYWELQEVTPNVRQFGAIGDDNTNALSSYYASLAAAQTQFPFVTALTQSADYAAFQAAANYARTFLVPLGSYVTTGTINIAFSGARILGENGLATIIRRTTAGQIFQAQISQENIHVDNIRFKGTGSTGIAVAATAGVLQGYLIKGRVTNCHFDYELAYGVDADGIFCIVDSNSFGYYGTGTKTGAMVAMRAVNVGSNFTNFNRFTNNIVHTGTTTTYALQLTAGDLWEIAWNDFEQGGGAIQTTNISELDIHHNWFEANNVTNGLITIDGTTDIVNIYRNFVSNNTCDSFIRYVSATVNGMDIHKNSIGLNSPSFVLRDATTLSATLPANGSVAFWKNKVAGGNAANRLVTQTNFRGGSESSRIQFTANTSSGAFSINDPSATYTKNGVGDFSIANLPFPMAQSIAQMIVNGGPSNGPTEWRALLTNTSSVRIQMFDDVGAPIEGQFGGEIKGF